MRRHGCSGAEIAARGQGVAFDHLNAPIERVAAPFTLVPLSPPLEDEYLPNADDVYLVARAVAGT